MDLVALLLHHDFIDSEGLIRPPASLNSDDFIARLKQAAGKEIYDFQVASSEESLDGRMIYLTQQDVRELQLAKGAIAAGTNMLLEIMGVSIEEVDEICLAGALGNYINPLSAMRIGLLPKVDLQVINPMGNAASTGAELVLLSQRHWQKASELRRFIEHVELSGHPEFLDNFVREMDFPEFNIW